MNQIKMSLVLTLTAAILSACSQTPTEPTANTQTQTTTSAEEPSNPESPPSETASSQASSPAATPKVDWITMGDYKFKLEPDIQKNGEAHLDFYVHDVAKDAHTPGLTGTFHITMPDGSKTTLPISEEKPYKHYHGKLMLEQFGEYQLAAQASLNGKKFNPRFSFARKK